MPTMFGQSSRSYNRRSSISNIAVVTPSRPVPYVPDPPSPRYHHGRRVVDVDVVNRSPDNYTYSPHSPRTLPRLTLRNVPSSPASSVSSFDDHDTRGQLAYYYQRQLTHRPTSGYGEENYQLALVPTGNREIVRSHPCGAYFVERAPAPERKKSTKKVTEPTVVERKQTMMLRDEKGNWTKVRRVIRS